MQKEVVHRLIETEGTKTAKTHRTPLDRIQSAMDLNSGLEDPPSFDNTKPTKAISGTQTGHEK